MRPLILGAALAFWGWRSGNFVAAALLALAAEAPNFLRARFEFRAVDLQRIADLCAVAFVALVVWLFASLEEPRTARAVLGSLTWLPAMLAPILLAQRLSPSGRIPLSALFRYLRKARQRDPTIPDPPIDLSGVYFAVCMLAAAIPNQRDSVFYAGTALLIAWALAPQRARHHSLATWLATLVLAAGIGYAAQLGLARLQGALDDWVSDWLVRGFAADPYRNTTDLGSVGRLKLVDAIVLRAYASDEEAPRLKLLHSASFNTLHGTTWLARQSPLAPVEPQADGTTWDLVAGAAGSPPGAPAGARPRDGARLERGKAVLPLPPGTLRVAELPAIAMRRNPLGATQIEFGGGDWSSYVAESAGGILGYAAPRAEDLRLPEAERAAFERLAAELGVAGMPARQALVRVRRHFAGFDYSIYREAPVPAGSTALGDFLGRTKSGHCEYFAAATTLLLRAAGIPARYATGFVLHEYSKLEGAYVVRARHAHAWSRAYVDGEWIDVDTTPPSWFDAEEALAPAWQSVADLLRWAGFRWSQRGAIEGGPVAYGVVALLVVVLGWRLARGKRVQPPAQQAAAARRRYPGADSEFYALQRHGRALERHADYRRAWRLHRRYRFDPLGLSREERAELRRLCLALARSLH